jgi:hypothetical protein
MEEDSTEYLDSMLERYGQHNAIRELYVGKRCKWSTTPEKTEPYLAGA